MITLSCKRAILCPIRIIVCHEYSLLIANDTSVYCGLSHWVKVFWERLLLSKYCEDEIVRSRQIECLGAVLTLSGSSSVLHVNVIEEWSCLVGLYFRLERAG